MMVTPKQKPYAPTVRTVVPNSADCMQVLSLEGNLCGDGEVTDDEACDDGNTPLKQNVITVRLPGVQRRL